MLLQRLAEYGGREQSNRPAGYEPMRVKYMVYLDETGGLLEILEQSDGQDRGKKNRGKEMVMPHVMKTRNIKANLLAENAEYALGILRPRKESRNPKTPAEEAAERHSAFVEQVRDCAEQTEEPTVRSVLRFVESVDPSVLPLPADFDPNSNLAFTVVTRGGDIQPTELGIVQEYWGAQKKANESVTADFECLVCGARGPVVQRMQLKVKGIPGLSTGLALISANEPPFFSYGLENSQNSPVCDDCATAFGRSLNKLIAEPATHYRVGPVQYVFWTKEFVPISWGDYFANPDPAQVRALLESVYSGRGGGVDFDAMPFYATALSASGGRAVVRDWLETTVGSAKAHLARYFRLQDLVDWNGEPGAPSSVSRLTNATLRIPKGANDEASPNVPRALLRVAIGGGRLPESLLYEAVKRNRAEQRVLRDRAVLIKMTLASRRGDEEGREWMVELDENTDEPAYLCGRLLAVLDAIQYAALGSVNATAVDRFYGTASSAPITVFPRLISGATPHLGKLRRERRRTYLALDGQVQAVLDRLRRNFPTVLTLEDQGLFALGFYHQKAADSRARLQRRGGQAANDVPDRGGRDGDTADDAADNDE